MGTGSDARVVYGAVHGRTRKFNQANAAAFLAMVCCMVELTHFHILHVKQSTCMLYIYNYCIATVHAQKVITILHNHTIILLYYRCPSQYIGTRCEQEANANPPNFNRAYEQTLETGMYRYKQ